MGQAVQALTTASKGIDSLTALAAQAKSIAQQALGQASGGAFYKGTVSITSANQLSLTAALAANNDKFSVQVGTGPVTTFTIATGETLAQLEAQLNTISGLSVTSVADPANAGNVFVQVQTTNGQSVKFLNVTNTPATAIFGAGVLNGGNALAATNVTPTDELALETSYNAIRSQIDNLVKDTSYNGKNLLNGDALTVQFNEKNTTSITVTGTKRDSAGLTIAAAAFDTVANIQSSLTDITNALNLLRQDGTSYGNNLAVYSGPPRLHRRPGWHLEGWRDLADHRRQERGRREPPCPANSAAAWHSVARPRFSGEPIGAPPVRLSNGRLRNPRRVGGAKPRRFFFACAVQNSKIMRVCARSASGWFPTMACFSRVGSPAALAINFLDSNPTF